MRKVNTHQLTTHIPFAGIFAFSLCSVWSLYHLFTASAEHPTVLYLVPSIMVEFLTAWTVYQVVECVRTLTRSNLSKQDRRFYRIIRGAFVLVALPTLGASVWANKLEFGGWVLGVLFPVSSIGCAIGAALPQAVARFERIKARERQEAKAARAEKVKATPIKLTVADYREFAASNGVVSRRDALSWAKDAGMDVSTATGKGNRDKVLRWCREEATC